MSLTREEFSDLLTSIATSDPDTQGGIVERIMSDYDERVHESTDGLPDGSGSWKEAYSELHRRYIKRFVDGVKDTSGEIVEKSSEEKQPMTFADLFS